MQLPNIDRSAIRPAGGEVVAPAGLKVVPVAPVNPPVSAQDGVGVVNDINPDVQAKAQQAAQSDPASDAQTETPKDWTQRKGEAAKPENAPPKEPLSKMLMDHIHSMWSASARVVEIWMQNNAVQNPAVNQQAQAQLQASNRNVDPAATPGLIAKETLTYSPSKVKKTEKTQ